nr:MAG TPA: hypothetical protein [Caudoviricetes sp.]
MVPRYCLKSYGYTTRQFGQFQLVAYCATYSSFSYSVSLRD